MKDLEGIEEGDWKLLEKEMQSQEAEAHEGMPLFSEAEAQRLQDKRGAAAAARRAARRQRAVHMQNCDTFCLAELHLTSYRRYLKVGEQEVEQQVRMCRSAISLRRNAEDCVLDGYDTDA